MFKHLWVERGMLSGLIKKTCSCSNSYSASEAKLTNKRGKCKKIKKSIV